MKQLNVAQGLEDFAEHGGDPTHKDRQNLLYKAAALLRQAQKRDYMWIHYEETGEIFLTVEDIDRYARTGQYPLGMMGCEFRRQISNMALAYAAAVREVHRLMA